MKTYVQTGFKYLNLSLFFREKGLLAVNITGHIFKTTDEPDTAVEMCIITNKHTEVC